MNEREIDRTEWTLMCLHGGDVDMRTTVNASSVDVEGVEGEFFVSVHPDADGVDVRVGDVQLIVMGRRMAVIQKHPPYPIKRWTVLWEGELR